MEDNRLMAKEFIRNNGISECDFMDSGVTDMFAELMEQYSNQQNANLIKQTESLSQVISSQKQTMDALIKKYEALKGKSDELYIEMKQLFYSTNVGEVEKILNEALYKYNQTKNP